VAANLDEAVDALQACLRVLDVVNRVGQMIKEEKYWSALRALEEVHSMPPASLSQTPLFQHLLSSLPSLRIQIKGAVNASTKQWLLMIRNNGTQVGKLAIDAMELRTRRWRARREKEPMFKLSRVGSAVECVSNEKVENNTFSNDNVQVDFKPLYQSIHIYTALDSLEELQKSYQEDRKAQSDLILSASLNLNSLDIITQEITGFFIIEREVLRTTRNFRNERDIEELWDSVVKRLTHGIEWALKNETEPEKFLRVKECLLAFIMTLESYAYSPTLLQSFILVLFEKYTVLLEKQFGTRFDNNILADDRTPMWMETATERDTTLNVVWLLRSEVDEIMSSPLPLNMPFSQAFFSCCQDIRGFVQKFYQFMDGVSQHHRNIDELLGNSLDRLLVQRVSSNIGKQLTTTTGLSQAAQMITNLEHFEVACSVLERSLTSLRSAQRGGTVRITAASSFSETLKTARDRITSIINSKLDDFFELSEYNWTPKSREESPSMYLYELVNWLTTVVDSLVIKDVYKDEAYQAAVNYIAECLSEFVFGQNVPVLNMNALSNVNIDLDFLESEFKRIGRPHLQDAFAELRLSISIVLDNLVQDYLTPSVRQSSYALIKPRRVHILLEKLAKFGKSSRDSAEREVGEKRQREADSVGKIYPGESRY